ncbi:MAG: hypothetical protein F2663_07485 [Actinobacteria bacterium]|uniref:Unannotated protein n=1 Tax=freshwater metagenome TaxID=449393 RepID=A0A6J6PVD3_9ZZZZ|nr:hypothetical protein [Actinomycetota bacterium]
MIDANEPVVAEIHVLVSPAEAFDAFTGRMGSWWPLKTHSILEGAADELVVEGWVGGEIFERLGDERHHWADITVWDPPSQLAYTWRVNPANPATNVVVDFVATDSGTHVRVTHSGWAVYAERAEQMRSSYRDGWPSVLAAFAALTER